MIAGNRKESIEDMRKRHIQEIESEKEAWQNELDYAKEAKKADYEKYCYVMLRIMDNTLNELNKI